MIQIRMWFLPSSLFVGKHRKVAKEKLRISLHVSEWNKNLILQLFMQIRKNFDTTLFTEAFEILRVSWLLLGNANLWLTRSIGQRAGDWVGLNVTLNCSFFSHSIIVCVDFWEIRSVLHNLKRGCKITMWKKRCEYFVDALYFLRGFQDFNLLQRLVVIDCQAHQAELCWMRWRNQRTWSSQCCQPASSRWQWVCTKESSTLNSQQWPNCRSSWACLLSQARVMK